jgi:hypothetical protein
MGCSQLQSDLLRQRTIFVDSIELCIVKNNGALFSRNPLMASVIHEYQVIL